MKSTKVNTEMKESKITLEALLEIISTSVEMFRGVVIETKDKFEVLSMNQIKRYYLPMEVVKFDIDDEVLGIKRLSVVLKAGTEN